MDTRSAASEQTSAEDAAAYRPKRFVAKPSFSRGFADWLHRNRTALVCSTYQTGHLIFIGARSSGQLAMTTAAFSRPMGLVAFSQRIYLAAQHEIWRLENVLRPGEVANDTFDRLFVPRNAQLTGDLDTHEIAVEPSGRIVFANTKHSCLATLSTIQSFKPIWKPKFISKLAAEDRCHLNGIAMEQGQARYVTACSQTDVVDGWRDRRHDGGVLIDITNDQVIADGLSMPHSPRVQGEHIYLLESGRGFLTRVERATGRREDVAFCPGFARGLVLHGDYAILTLSLPRAGSFTGLALEASLQERGATARCGVQIIDTRNGDVVEWTRFGGDVTELFDVAAIDGARCPRGLGPTDGDLSETIRWETGA